MEIKKVNQPQTILVKGKKEAVLVNPEAGDTKKYNSRIVIYNNTQDESQRSAGEVVSIIGPGEYEIGGVEIVGINGGERVVYSVVMEGVTVVFLAKIREMLSDKKIEKVNSADVLVVDVANGETVGFKAILEVAKKWGVNYLIPVGETEAGKEWMTKFLDETDSEGQEAVEGLKIDKDNLPDGMEVVVLK